MCALALCCLQRFLMSKDDRDSRCSFVFVEHPQHGYLLLSSKNVKKGSTDSQTPGGHVDVAELVAAQAIGTPEALDAMFRAVAARELYEETGMNIRQDLGRLRRLESDHPLKVFFLLEVNDGDFSKVASEPGAPLVPGAGAASLKLRLSHEHTAWRFEKDKAVAAEAMKLHSGGAPSEILGKLSSL